MIKQILGVPQIPIIHRCMKVSNLPYLNWYVPPKNLKNPYPKDPSKQTVNYSNVFSTSTKKVSFRASEVCEGR